MSRNQPKLRASEVPLSGCLLPFSNKTGHVATVALESIPKQRYDYSYQTKLQSMTWKRPSSPTPKKVKAGRSAGKIMGFLYWGSKGVVMIENLARGAVMVFFYAEQIKKNCDEIRKKQRGKLAKIVLFKLNNASAHRLDPERHRVAKLEGKWLNPKVGADDEWSDEEIQKFISDTMRALRGRSTYYNSYCAHLSPEFKTRPFVPKPKRRRRTLKPGEKKVEENLESKPSKEKLALKDTQVMKIARELYERDMNAPTLEPLPTHLRTFVYSVSTRSQQLINEDEQIPVQAYSRPCLYKTGTSEYQESMGRLAYETVCKSHWPPLLLHNGCRGQWGYPPELPRQPELDILPFVGDRLF
ncbi:hypothetical protein EVAR_83715_1 [Eumeta japonica]|uniref:Mariner Mos1 transposase n=1 Tax=Eumeta variegata TaxID=151549 RepID=A0A4C1WCX3_EUMVA|nr:hypothetical protein EVAR_83715_1 [Eumeta japonica]